MSQQPQRNRLPASRPSITHKRTICGRRVWVTVGFYNAPGQRTCPGEVFIHMEQHGDLVAGMLDGFCVLLSMMLQYGTPFEVVESKFRGTRFGQQDVYFNPATQKSEEQTSFLDGLMQVIRHTIDERRLHEGGDGTEGVTADLQPTPTPDSASAAKVPPPGSIGAVQAVTALGERVLKFKRDELKEQEQYEQRMAEIAADVQRERWTA